MSKAGATVVEVVGGGGDEKLAVGKAYAVTLTTGIEFKGIVLAYDSNIVIFQDGPMPIPGDSITTRMVNTKFISDLRLMGKFTKDELAAKNRSVDLGGLISKEEIAIKDIEKLGVGVTKEAQSIFDALSKTHTVKWEKKDILVMGNVRVCSPYTCDRVTGGKTSINNEVKKELKLVRQKLQLNEGK